MGADVRLDEDIGMGEINAAGEIERGDRVGIIREYLGIMRHGNCVQIHNTKEIVVLVLNLNPVTNRPQIVSEVEIAGRLYARKYALFAHEDC